MAAAALRLGQRRRPCHQLRPNLLLRRKSNETQTNNENIEIQELTIYRRGRRCDPDLRRRWCFRIRPPTMMAFPIPKSDAHNEEDDQSRSCRKRGSRVFPQIFSNSFVRTKSLIPKFIKDYNRFPRNACQNIRNVPHSLARVRKHHKALTGILNAFSDPLTSKNHTGRYVNRNSDPIAPPFTVQQALRHNDQDRREWNNMKISKNTHTLKDLEEKTVDTASLPH